MIFDNIFVSYRFNIMPDVHRNLRLLTCHSCPMLLFLSLVLCFYDLVVIVHAAPLNKTVESADTGNGSSKQRASNDLLDIQSLVNVTHAVVDSEQKDYKEHVPVLQGLGYKSLKNNTEHESPGPQQHNPVSSTLKVDNPENLKFVADEPEDQHVGV